jgi:lipopolysaccharide transport system permease protein
MAQPWQPVLGRSRIAARLTRGYHRAPRTRVIQPRTASIRQQLAAVWTTRHFAPYFADRLLQKFYTRTWLGWLWVPLRPLADVGARVLLFGAFLGVPSGDRPYLIFFLVGMTAWQLFERMFYWGTRSLELTRDVFRKMYLPRLTAVLASALPPFLESGLYALMLIMAGAFYALTDGTSYLTVTPESLGLAALGLALLLLLGLGITLWTSVFGARARDLRFSFAYFMALWFFLTPVIYPVSAIPKQFHTLVELNPATGPVTLVKQGLLEGAAATSLSLTVTVATILVLVPSGLWFFLRWEQLAADSL